MIVFFTYRVALATWAERGILERETELYRRLAPHVGGVAFVTYGPDDAALAPRVAPIAVLPRPATLGEAAASLLAPWLHRRAIRGARVLRTHQASGAWTAVLAKWLWRKPLIVRCGYPWSFNYARESPSAWRRRAVRLAERLAVRAADRVIVTTARGAEYLCAAHGLDRARVRIVPNFVDTRRFAPDPAAAPEKGLVVAVGRLTPEKDLGLLLEAIGRVRGARLLLVGDGPERAWLERRARAVGAPLELAGTVANDRLPAILNRAEVFAITSRYEGQPKALLEAMACGLAVVGTDAPGIRDVVRPGETGWLAPANAESVAAALTAALDDQAARARAGRAARAEVERRYALEAVVQQELAVVRELSA